MAFAPRGFSTTTPSSTEATSASPSVSAIIILRSPRRVSISAGQALRTDCADNAVGSLGRGVGGSYASGDASARAAAAGPGTARPTTGATPPPTPTPPHPPPPPPPRTPPPYPPA